MKAIAYLKEYSGFAKRTQANELQKLEANITKTWEKKWICDMQATNSHTASEAIPETNEFRFESWLVTNVAFLGSSAKYNKRMNFLSKFMVILLLSVGLKMFYDIYRNIFQEGESIFTIIYPLIPSYMIYKWINVKKYQETWSRSTSARTKILLEMVKYIYNMNPYQEQDRQVQFIHTILMLTDKNVQKFKHNMEKNESSILPEKFPDKPES